jgi:hypothetical protein
MNALRIVLVAGALALASAAAEAQTPARIRGTITGIDSAQVAPDGKLTALRVQVSKDGVKPPQ